MNQPLSLFNYLKKSIFLIILLVAIISADIHAQSNTSSDANNMDELMSLSLENLLEVTVITGSLVSTKANNTPVFNTKITNEMIQNSGAKNIADLI